MNKRPMRMRQVMDWSAAIWAGLISGAVFLLLNMFLTPTFIGGNPWVVLRYLASIVLGEGVLPPPATASLTVLLAALLVNFLLSVIFSLLLAFMIHRWGLIVGIIGGALFGLGVYAINFYTLTLLFPWFFAIRNWVFVLAHIIFGAMAGGIYEALEVEEFVPVEEE